MLVVVAMLALPTAASAQMLRVRGQKRGTDAEDTDKVFPVAPRNTLKLLSDARKLLTQNRLGEAIKKLGEVLESPDDFLIQLDKNAAVHTSLKAEAERLLGEMPREGRDLYELQYGARARQMLSEAVDAGDMERVAEVSRRFFHTKAGGQASLLVGQDHLNHDRPMAGALVLQRLRRDSTATKELEPTLSLTLASCWLKAGEPQKAKEAMAVLRQRDQATRVTVGGRELPSFADDAAAIRWLADQIGPQSTPSRTEKDRWWMFRGNAARNAATIGGPPLLNVRWRVLVSDDPLAESNLEQNQRSLIESGAPILPAFHPLAVDHVVLMRTLQTLLAIDFATGKLLWEVPTDDAADGSQDASNDEGARSLAVAANASLRMWRDLTFGTLSSDGRSVYSVEDLEANYTQGIQIIGRRVIRFGAFGQQADQATPCNRLAAHDIRTGKTVWELGGPAGPRALPLAETFFLGPPLPLMGQLYVLAETKSEVQLLALDGATGTVLWSQRLSQAEQADAQHRWIGASPSYADGVLVCPTSTGAVVAVELATRSLLWGFCYGRDGSSQRNAGIAFAAATSPSDMHWADASASIRDGRVIFAAPDSDRLYCLSLLDGKLLWKCPRQDASHDDLYVASVDGGRVVLVGRSGVHALQLADGKPAWKGRIVALPKQSAPSGRGFQTGHRYFLPLTSAEVVAIDLKDGRIVGSWKSRKGNVPGNLVSHEGKILSQEALGLSAYYQLDAVEADIRRRLAANPNDPEALSLQGEVLLSNDQCSEAIASFRRAYVSSPGPRTRELLRDALLEGLTTDFPTYRKHSSEIERLLDDSSQRAAYLRAMITGLRQANDWASAFERCLQLADLEPDRRPLDAIDPWLSVRRDRWIRAQVAELQRNAPPEAAAAMNGPLTARLRSAMAARSIEPLEEYLGYFGDRPAASAAWNELVRRLRTAGRLIEAELAAVSSSGKKPRGERLLASSDEAMAWPTGKIEVSTSRTGNMAGISHNSFPVQWEGPHPFFRDLSLRYDYNRVSVIAVDGFGRERWQLSLRESGQPQEFTRNATQTRVRAVGHLLLMSLGSKLIALDTLGSGPKSKPRVLWTADQAGAANETIRFRRLGMMQAFGNLPFQIQQQLIQSSFETSEFTGVANSRQICFQRQRDLVALDPATGKTLWIRQGMPANSELFGDDRSLFVLSQDREEATLLDAFSGERLGTRKIPRTSGTQVLPNGETKVSYAPLQASSLGVFGRNVLLWWQEGHRRLMTLTDPLEGRDLWPEGWRFASTARACVIDDEAVGVLEPSGRFVLVSLPEGRTIADIKLQAEPTLQDIAVFHDGDRYFLLTRGGSALGPSPMLQPMPQAFSGSYNPIYRGRLYAFDEHGKLAWPEPVTITNQLFWTNQPPQLPILIFGCQLHEQAANGQGQWKPTVLCIDKRTGKTAYSGQFKNMIGFFGVRCDPAQKTIDIIVQQDTVTLKFTNKTTTKPAADEKPLEQKPAEKRKSPAKH
ncbi:MAG: PQQ-binding-like beta-propeller repeat protein [Thermoguttaceae bacterium]